ncbi:UDP-N-acetylmuramyl-tripeptide synthetase [Candidatus Kaiserbacteria bacterium]|nr:UDP-N-acetylmuramyl-tripeptide synthetase [Candidatus Kaiserbacteria bacterium]
MDSIGKQHTWLEKLLRFTEKLIPKRLYQLGQPTYHFLLALLGALVYRFPSKDIHVIFVTGTKGKTTTVELINAILEKNGYTTALASTLRFKVGETSERNLYKMTLRGRFFVQRFLRKAVAAKCTYAIVEMTSESVTQSRHRFISPNALVFTNLSPEHIESHGSFENYVQAKLKLRDAVEHSPKKDAVVIANIDDEHGKDFLKVSRAQGIPFSLQDVTYTTTPSGLTIMYKNISIQSKLEGVFNVQNILAAIKLGEYLEIPLDIIKQGIENVSLIRGRVEHVSRGQLFDVVVDYAHTPDSLEKLYETFAHKKMICVLGNTGGGRDTWKRPEMGRIAEEYCENVILTNEDPYDEDPEQIVLDMKEGMNKEPTICMDRRKAIHEACVRAHKKPIETAVIITGKGTDPYIMEAHGKKTPWDDATVVREELDKIISV